MDNGRMMPEDYLDDNLPYHRTIGETPIPIAHLIEKLDAYLAQNDYAAAERHLRYWEAEAKANGNPHALFTIINEQIGLYRKLGRKEEALERAEYVLRAVEENRLSDSVAGATAMINAATAYKAFGRGYDAIALYRAAEIIYTRDLPEDDERLGGLYNNYALALCEAGNYEAAEFCLFRAIGIMDLNRMLPEKAVSYLNLADLYALRDGNEAGEEHIGKCLDEAERLLDDPACPRDGNYAFVCEKCSPVFDDYGRFVFAAELRERMKAIYEGT